MKKIFYTIIIATLPCISNAQILSIQAILDSVNIDTLMFRTEEISGERGVFLNGSVDTIFSRNRNRPGNELAFKFIRNKLISYGYQVDSASFGSAGGKNIWAKKMGMVYPNKKVIICAHYDAMPNGPISPGADDNAASVATVLEAARLMANYSFEYTIIFALWDDEEYGLLGSANYANTAYIDNDTIHGVINMDAIAHDSDNDSVARVHAKPIGNSEAIADTVLSVNIQYNIGLNMILVNPGATYSDHASFWNRYFGAVLIIQDWDNDSNPQYHLASDSTYYFNIPYFHKLAKLSIGSAAALAVPFETPSGQAIMEKTLEVVNINPNPTNGILTVTWKQEFIMIQVVDLLGKVVYSAPLPNGVRITTIDVSALNKGVHFLKLINEDGQVMKKFIKK
ncbi:MAG TPA: M20/M25/M40 family metallo-hydrolase [Bacteroidia bacterium]|nr:M20/M25/M40 family metallo-hydrolase [Bacteroidia bacterium]